MKPEFREKNPPITQEEIEQFENKIGYKLPQDYKNFVLEQNGGNVIDRYRHKEEKPPNSEGILCHKIVFDDGEIFYAPFTKFFALESTYLLDESSPSSQVNYDSEFYGNYGVHLFIGYDGDGNSTTISLNENDYGAVYRFDSFGNFDEPDKDCAKISNSFEEFYNTFEFHDFENE
jgi:hypothetical protein